MRSGSRAVRLVSLFVLALVAGGLGLGAAIAQDQNAQQGEGEGEGEVAVRRRANLTGPEQIAEADRINTRGTQISRRIAQMLDEARRERDIIRITCLNDKLTQVNANLRTVEERFGNLREAVQANDGGRRSHEFTVITVLGQKFNVLEQEANQCIGQDIYETGATRITTIVEPGEPEENPAVTPEMPPIGVPPIPPPMSPTS